MKTIIFFSLILLYSCNKQKESIVESDGVLKPVDTEKVHTPYPSPTPPKYANARFKEVTLQKIDSTKFRIQGMGQIFEASFGWVVEDGHNELKKGFEMTDAGAPDWGKFDFTINVSKENPNSTLTLILFETSAKDGSRQHELAIPLP